MADKNSYFDKSQPISDTNIPYNLRSENVINNDVMHSVGLYSQQEIEDARFSRYSRFGRVLDQYGKLNDCREYLFFVKPDLHIAVPVKEMGISTQAYQIREDAKQYFILHPLRLKSSVDASNLKGESIYKLGYSSASLQYDVSNKNECLILNPQLYNNSYFRELITSHPGVIRELQKSAPCIDGGESIDPFCHLLSFSVNSYLEMPGSEASTLDNPSTVFGTSYEYLKDAEEADENPTFSLEFVDNKYLDTYHFFKAYSEYHIARKSGLVTPPSRDYYRYKRLHNTMGIYKFIVAEDMETIIYYAYFWGVFPTSTPRETFSDPLFSEGLTFSVNFKAAFMEDMNPIILKQFNQLMIPLLDNNGIKKDNWLPVVKQNMLSQTLYAKTFGEAAIPIRDNSYDPISLGYPGKNLWINGRDENGNYITSEIYPTAMTNGELPFAALVDGRSISTAERSVDEGRQKYKLRWYGLPKGVTN